MLKKLLLIGAGGHCHSVLDSIDVCRYSDVAILDAAESVGKTICGVPVIGTDKDAQRLFHDGYTQAVIAVGSIGDSTIRARLYEKFTAMGFEFPPIIDSTAIVSKTAHIGKGVFIGKGAIVNTNVEIRDCCIINTGAIIDHDCKIDEFVHIGPAVSMSGGIHVGKNSHVGVGSTIIQSLNIGENTIIGAGSVVIGDIPPNVVAVGIPCKPIKSNEV